MLISLTGYAGVGKDEVGKVLVDRYGFRRLAFADRVRKMARAIDPYVQLYDGGVVRLSEILPDEDTSAAWSEIKKYPDVRRLLQRIGTEAGRNVLYEDVWVESTLREVEPGEHVVITDARFLNELQMTTDHGGLTWRIYRPGTGPLNDHPSETEQDKWVPHYAIDNSGTLDDLAVEVEKALAYADAVAAGEAGWGFVGAER